MAIREEPNDEPLDQVRLAHDDFADFGEKRPDKGADFLDFIVDGRDSRIHCGTV